MLLRTFSESRYGRISKGGHGSPRKEALALTALEVDRTSLETRWFGMDISKHLTRSEMTADAIDLRDVEFKALGGKTACGFLGKLRDLGLALRTPYEKSFLVGCNTGHEYIKKIYENL